MADRSDPRRVRARLLRANNSGGGSRPLDRLRSYFTDAVLSAIYSSQAGVTVGSGVVSQWDDARGATGFAPSLIGTGTAKPAYAVGADGIPTITFDGVDDLLSTSGTSALFDVSGAKSLVVIAASPQTVGATYLAGISDGASANRFLGVQQTAGAGGVFRGVGGAGAGIVATSIVTVSATRRLFIASKDAGGNVNVDVPNQARVTAAGAASNAGNNGFAIGAFFGAAGSSKAVAVASLLIARQVTAADIVQLQAFAASLNYVPA